MPVSIPFVSGQALQRVAFAFGSRSGRSCFNPLRIGASTATEKGNDMTGHPISLFQSPSYRGKHCNTSCTASSVSGPDRFNPLRIGASTATLYVWMHHFHFRRFNPLRIGASTATIALGEHPLTVLGFQSPSYRGKHCNHTGFRAYLHDVAFQSPSYRGKHCNLVEFRTTVVTGQKFQSPSYRGKHCNITRSAQRVVRSRVSIPFVSGQALQPLHN